MAMLVLLALYLQVQPVVKRGELSAVSAGNEQGLSPTTVPFSLKTCGFILGGLGGLWFGLGFGVLFCFLLQRGVCATVRTSLKLPTAVTVSGILAAQSSA